MEYYIVTRGDERKWNKQTESLRSTNVKSSLLVVRGSVSAEHGGLIGVQVLSALNPVDSLHNCMFENKLCLQNVFAKKYFAMFQKAPEVGNIIQCCENV